MEWDLPLIWEAFQKQQVVLRSLLQMILKGGIQEITKFWDPMMALILLQLQQD